MANVIHDVGVARQIGTYSDAVEAPPDARWLFTSGTPGLSTDGDLPDDIAGQAEIAWQHIIAMLQAIKSAGAIHAELIVQTAVRPATTRAAGSRSHATSC